MSEKAIVTKNPKTNTSATINYDFGSTVAEAVEKFGEDVVLSNFVSAATVTAQGAVRRMLGAGKSEAEIVEKMSAWKPGVALAREAQDPMVAALAKFNTLSPEEKEAYIETLRQKAAGN